MTNELLKKASKLASCSLASMLLLGTARADKISVWVDDAHTRQIEVDELDPDEIADPSSFGLGYGTSIGSVSVSVAWSREKGVEYDKQVEKLIKKVRKLCKEFNEGQMSLETYQRRIRGIFSAIESARLAGMELAVNNAIAASKQGSKLDELLGLPASDSAAFEARISGALDAFRTLVESIPPDELPELGDGEVFEADQVADLDRSQRAVRERMAELDAALDPRAITRKGDRKLITIWKDEAHSKQISVPMLDVEGLVEDFKESLCVQMKYSPPLVCRYVGPEVNWTLQTRAKYDEAAQLLIIKYRKLCLDYNGGFLSQEGYMERLVELMEAERRAFAAREEMTKRMNERADAMRSELNRLLGDKGSGLAGELRERSKEMGSAAAKKQREGQGPSAVEELSRKHREDMAAWDAFVASVGEFAVEPPSDPVEVDIADDPAQGKVTVQKLDTDLIAQNVKTRLSLHISFFDFGPEASWAQEKGLEYGRAAQELIVKSKALCMEFNAGLLSQESYLRRSRQIDASVEKAAKVREGLVDFYSELKGAARDKLDRRLKMPRRGSAPRDGD